MSSYVIEKQSRGAGAIAAHDLGAVSRASGSPVKSRSQIRSAARAPAQVMAPKAPASQCPSGEVWDRVEKMCRYFGPKQTKPPVLISRKTVAGVPIPTRIGVPGKALTPKGNVSKTDFYEVGRKSRTAKESVTIIDKPAVPAVAGVVPGSLPQFVAQKRAVADQAAELDMIEEEIQVPQISPSATVAQKTGMNKVLVYGGIGAAALLVYYLATRRS